MTYSSHYAARFRDSTQSVERNGNDEVVVPLYKWTDIARLADGFTDELVDAASALDLAEAYYDVSISL